MSGSFHEIEAFLNERDASRPSRREHHLPRPAYSDPSAVFHLTKCARHHQRPFADPGLAGEIIEAIRFRQREGIWRVYAFCLMPDHLHLVIQLVAPPEATETHLDLHEVLGRFSSFTTRAAWRRGIRGKLWQHDQYDRLLRSNREFTTTCQYVLDNPVRKGLAGDWTEWPYSGVLEDW
ncbi:MAG: REP-associated tyrosine transposase [Actinomycetota bacterium]